MPMRLAVLATRQAISPRLAIRILANTGRALFFLLGALFHRLPHPGGLALLEECAHAFSAFLGRPCTRDAARHIGPRFGCDWPLRDRVDPILRCSVCPPRALHELAPDSD